MLITEFYIIIIYLLIYSELWHPWMNVVFTVNSFFAISLAMIYICSLCVNYTLFAKSAVIHTDTSKQYFLSSLDVTIFSYLTQKKRIYY